MCIIQDSRADWGEQVTEMANVFENATITIAASASSDPNVSIFPQQCLNHQAIELNTRSDRSLSSVIFKARRKIQLGIHAKNQWSTEFDPLDLRAWTLQERELSTRFISFTSAEMQWKCRQIKSCECQATPYDSEILFEPPSTSINEDKPTRNLIAWARVVEEYTSRELTVIADRLPGLIGLASKFHATTGMTYIAGLWAENLLTCLVWQRGSQSLCAPLTHLALSFSWASVAGPVNFQFGRFTYHGIRKTHIEFLQVDYDTVDGKPFSKAIKGSFTARGYTVVAQLRSLVPSDHQAYEICIEGVVYQPSTGQRVSCEFSIDTLLASVSVQEQEDQLTISRKRPGYYALDKVDDLVKFLSLFSIYHQDYAYEIFLILGMSSTDSNSYERIGIGTGKIYSDSNRVSKSSEIPKAIRPFEWLIVDLKKKGSDTQGAVEEVVCVQ